MPWNETFKIPDRRGTSPFLTALLKSRMVAFLQAYVFAILTCIYLNDALHMH